MRPLRRVWPLVWLCPISACDGPPDPSAPAPGGPRNTPAETSLPSGAVLASIGPQLVSAETKLTASDATAGDYFGVALSGAGDVDGDGYDDIVIGAQADDDMGSASGSLYVYSGGTSGIDTASETKLVASDGGSSDYIGCSVTGGGDFDGDGYADVVSGAYGDSDAAFFAGSAYVWYGGSAGVDAATEQEIHASDAAGADYFGISVAVAGDLDGDGFDELAVGADGDDDVASDGGAVYVYYGSTAGLDTSSEDKLSVADAAYQDLFGATFGVAGAGDLDGDGYDDLLATAYLDDDDGSGSGSLFVYYGGASRSLAGTVEEVNASDASSGAMFGWSVAAAGDIDADGYADIAVGAVGDGTRGSNAGAVYVYHGASGGLSTSSEQKITASDGASGDRFAITLQGAGDVDADGYDDLVVGAQMDDDYGTDAGAFYVFAGSSSGIDTSSEEKVTASDAAADDYFGRSVVGLGDTNGDGYADLAAGAYRNDDAGTESGSVYLYQGPCTDLDGDAVCNGDDCDDTDPDTFPGAAPNDSVTDCMTDVDGDDWGEASPVAGVTTGTDCNDADAAVHPGATEVCDAGDTDEDCSGDADDLDAGVDTTGFTSWQLDADADGYGNAPDADGALSVSQCDAPAGYVADASDCDDGDVAVNAASVEVCDTLETDEDCSGAADDADAGVDATGFSTWYADGDGDGYGDPGRSASQCHAPADFVAVAGDCDDADSTVNAAATEVCDPADVDEDCSGAADDADPGVDVVSRGWFYADADADGYGDPAVGTAACEAPPATVTDRRDCDDTDPAIHPAATESPGDAVDQDCDGAELCFVDADGDGHRDPGGESVVSAALACDGAGEASATLPADDCDDARADVNPEAVELCNERDDDCDGTVDGPGSADAPSWQADADADGYTDPDDATIDCVPARGYALPSTDPDCDDAEPSVHPGGDDIAGDDVDQDCDGTDTPAATAGAEAGCGCTGAPSGGVSALGLLLVGLGVRRGTRVPPSAPGQASVREALSS